MVAQSLIEEHAAGIVARLIAEALAGKTSAIRLCLDRIAPRQGEAAIEVELPQIETAADCGKALSALIAATASAEVTPSDALKIAKLIEARLEAFVTPQQGEPETAPAPASREAKSRGLQQSAANGAKTGWPTAEKSLGLQQTAAKHGGSLDPATSPDRQQAACAPSQQLQSAWRRALLETASPLAA
jgi:hypothetical protein